MNPESFCQIYAENPCSSHLLLIHSSMSAGHWIGDRKIEIKLDPQDIEKIAQRLADIILRSFMEVESRYRLPRTHPEKPPAEKTWKMPDGSFSYSQHGGISPQHGWPESGEDS